MIQYTSFAPWGAAVPPMAMRIEAMHTALGRQVISDYVIRRHAVTDRQGNGVIVIAVHAPARLHAVYEISLAHESEAW